MKTADQRRSIRGQRIMAKMKVAMATAIDEYKRDFLILSNISSLYHVLAFGVLVKV